MHHGYSRANKTAIIIIVVFKVAYTLYYQGIFRVLCSFLQAKVHYFFNQDGKIIRVSQETVCKNQRACNVSSTAVI